MIRADKKEGIAIDGSALELMDDLANIVSAIKEVFMEEVEEEIADARIELAVKTGCIYEQPTLM